MRGVIVPLSYNYPMNFLNLTNGIEYIPELSRVDGYVRIQSTACEQKRWWFILSELDYSFLIPVVSGTAVTIYDASQRKQVSRALYQGLEWISFALVRFYFGESKKTFVNNNNVTAYFEKCYQNEDEYKKIALNKMRYVSKIVVPHYPDITVVCRQTKLDGKYDIYKELLMSHLE
jgi:hypothetical protein